MLRFNLSLSYSDDKTVRLWNTTSRKNIRTMKTNWIIIKVYFNNIFESGSAD